MVKKHRFLGYFCPKNRLFLKSYQQSAFFYYSIYLQCFTLCFLLFSPPFFSFFQLLYFAVFKRGKRRGNTPKKQPQNHSKKQHENETENLVLNAEK